MSVEPMVKVRALAAKRDKARVVQALYDFGAIHVTPAAALPLDKPLERYADISTQLVKLRALEARLGLKDKLAPARDAPLKDVLRDAAAISQDELQSIEAGLQAAVDEARALAEREAELTPFAGLPLPPERLAHPRLAFHYVELRGGADALRREAGDWAAVTVVPAGKTAFALLAAPKADAARTEALLKAFAGRVLPIPAVSEKSFAAALEAVRRKRAGAEKRAASLRAARAAFEAKHAKAIVALRKALEKEARLAALPTQFGESALVTAVEGWVPAAKLAALERALGHALNGKVAVERVDARDAPPVKLKNPLPVSPFEFFIRFFSLPAKGERDPTLFVFLTFPVFFGMILGDIGYGIVGAALGLALFLRSKPGFFKDVGGILSLAGAATIAFGFAYGEFFGFEDAFGHHLTPLVHRVDPHGVEVLIGLSILVGLVHLAVGFLLGAIENARHGHAKHAIAKLGWLGVELSLIGLIASSVDMAFFAFVTPTAQAIGALPLGLAALASLAVIAWSEGAVALVELPGLFSNIFSYLRIVALGLAAVVLAVIITQIRADFGAAFANGFDAGAFIVAVLMLALFVFAQVGAFALGVFEAGIQSLRLHYVEFFSKFYKGGGRAFQPLREETA